MSGSSGAPWTAATIWEDGQPATAGQSYRVSGLMLSSPRSGGAISFPGDRLRIEAGGSLRVATFNVAEFLMPSGIPIEIADSTL